MPRNVAPLERDGIMAHLLLIDDDPAVIPEQGFGRTFSPKPANRVGGRFRPAPPGLSAVRPQSAGRYPAWIFACPMARAWETV